MTTEIIKLMAWGGVTVMIALLLAWLAWEFPGLD